MGSAAKIGKKWGKARDMTLLPVAKTSLNITQRKS